MSFIFTYKRINDVLWFHLSFNIIFRFINIHILTFSYCLIPGIFIVLTVMIFGDNAFRLQCKDFWLGNPNENHLSYSWGFEIIAALFAFMSGGFIVWLGVLRSRDDI